MLHPVQEIFMTGCQDGKPALCHPFDKSQNTPCASSRQPTWVPCQKKPRPAQSGSQLVCSLGYSFIIDTYLTKFTDRGGTFTDVVVFHEDGRERVFKLLSHDPDNYKDAPTEALRRILEDVEGRKIPRNIPLNLDSIGEQSTAPSKQPV